ncbi:MAG: nucleotide exchange factor GrpE [Agathobacter sp.]|nr:nucleotide exchange factor GrpE [Agathobacter sp.]
MADEKACFNEEVDEAVDVTEETTENAEVEEQQETEETIVEEKDSKEDSEESEEKPKKDGFFKKKKDKKEEQIEELNDRVRRQMAEFDNFRKRSEKEKSQMFDMGAKNVIEKILPVVDNFERGFTTVEEADQDDAFVQGMQQVYKQLMTELEAIGVKPIEAVGQEFNPDFHNAVMQVESEEYESGIIAQEFMKGYMYKDTVVRHSMVGVVS